MLRVTTMSLAVVLGLSTAANAQEDYVSLLQDHAAQLQEWLTDAAVVSAVRAQNEMHAALTEAEILDLDQQWRGETGANDRPFIDRVLGSDLSAYLQGVRDASQGMYTEIFVMDNRGLNVGQSDVTSDYWQGDEAKFQETFGVGADAVHVSEVEMDESTQTFQSQLSVPVVDPDTNEVIGAVTVGVDVDLLMQ